MSNNLAYNQGIKAFQNNLGTHLNPYSESDYRHSEWLLGYSNAEQGKNEMASVNVKYMMRVVDPEPLLTLLVK
jgi:hypothetical protein